MSNRTLETNVRIIIPQAPGAFEVIGSRTLVPVAELSDATLRAIGAGITDDMLARARERRMLARADGIQRAVDVGTGFALPVAPGDILTELGGTQAHGATVGHELNRDGGTGETKALGAPAIAADAPAAQTGQPAARTDADTLLESEQALKRSTSRPRSRTGGGTRTPAQKRARRLADVKRKAKAQRKPKSGAKKAKARKR